MAEGGQAGSVLVNRLIDPALLWDFENEYTSQQTALKIVDPLTGTDIHITNVYINVKGVVDVSIHLLDNTLKWKYYGTASGNGVFGRLRGPIVISPGQPLYVTSNSGATFFLMLSGYYRRR